MGSAQGTPPVVDVKSLAELQDIDSQIERSKKRLAEIQGQLAENTELKAARAELQAQEHGLRELEGRQKSIEWDVEATRDRIKDLQNRMMGNRVGNPRDLPNIQRELDNLQQRQRMLEDNVLTLMEQIERARKARDQQGETVTALERKWTESRTQLMEEKKRVEEELPRWEDRRRACAEALDQPTRKTYERLRLQKGGRAVARVEGGICTGCRITVPGMLVQRARAGKEIVYCSSCGRILYVS